MWPNILTKRLSSSINDAVMNDRIMYITTEHPVAASLI